MRLEPDTRPQFPSILRNLILKTMVHSIVSSLRLLRNLPIIPTFHCSCLHILLLAGVCVNPSESGDPYNIFIYGHAGNSPDINLMDDGSSRGSRIVHVSQLHPVPIIPPARPPLRVGIAWSRSVSRIDTCALRYVSSCPRPWLHIIICRVEYISKILLTMMAAMAVVERLGENIHML